MMLSGVWLILVLILMVIIGVVVGMFLSRFTMKKYFEKNPPISEDMIRSMMEGMGQKPNQKKINQIMKKIKTQS